MENVTILDYRPEHQSVFEKLNRSWIEQNYRMEELDEFVLTRPEEAILQPGGVILIALYDGVAAGTVGLRKVDDHTYEFTKMAVDENFRRKGIAEALTYASFEKAASLGATRIILFTNSRQTAATELYLKSGFRHLLLEEGVYERADIKMEKWLVDPPLPGSIKIIRALPSHAPIISGIGKQTFRLAFGELFHSQEELKEYLALTYAVPKLAASIKKEYNVYYLALAGEQPVGFVKLKKYSLNEQIEALSQMELQKIYVLPEFHGKGAGDALLQAAVDLAREERACHLWLDTYVGNARGIRFYQKHGFNIAGKHHFTIGTQTFEYHVMDRLIELPKPKQSGRNFQLKPSGKLTSK